MQEAGDQPSGLWAHVECINQKYSIPNTSKLMRITYQPSKICATVQHHEACASATDLGQGHPALSSFHPSRYAWASPGPVGRSRPEVQDCFTESDPLGVRPRSPVELA